MNEEFFSRERAAGYDPAVLENAVVLLVGTGALGQAIALLLALCQIGTLLLVDFDRWELHNATRSPFFPNRHERIRWGVQKSTVVAHKLRQMTHWSKRPRVLYASKPIEALGDAPFRHATVVVSAVDAENARNYIGHKAAEFGVPHVEGGFRAARENATILLNDKQDAPCWHCNLYDRQDHKKKVQLGCTSVAREAEEAGFTPAIQTAAMHLAALMIETVIQILHGSTQLADQQIFANIRTATSQAVKLTFNPSCRHHSTRSTADLGIELAPNANCEQLLEQLGRRLAHPVVHLPFDFLVRVGCAQCKQPIKVLEPDWVLAKLLFCRECGGIYQRTGTPGNEIYATLSRHTEPLLRVPADRLGLVSGSLLEVESPEKNILVELRGSNALPFFTEV